MKIVGIADTHFSHEDVIVPAGDVLVVAGDFCGQGTLSDVAVFNKWLGTLPHAHKIVVAGNHDLCCQNNYLLIKKMFTSAHYLCSEAVVIDGVKFYGEPRSPAFNNWAFSYEPQQAATVWRGVPHDTNVLITHGPPAAVGLSTVMRWKDGEPEDAGCPALHDLIAQLPQLKASFHGHIHEGFGQAAIGAAMCFNVSVMDGSYAVVHPGTLIDIKEA